MKIKQIQSNNYTCNQYRSTATTKLTDLTSSLIDISYTHTHKY
ncbi:MAG: hypothetical protein O7C56_09100 [Rickettsia endosymbiont of Ixodes persulcatus]|nr:hypothetical protein [Rickettsia endosymbiont of Ixodes persulcatus]